MRGGLTQIPRPVGQTGGPRSPLEGGDLPPLTFLSTPVFRFSSLGFSVLRFVLRFGPTAPAAPVFSPSDSPCVSPCVWRVESLLQPESEFPHQTQPPRDTSLPVSIFGGRSLDTGARRVVGSWGVLVWCLCTCVSGVSDVEVLQRLDELTVGGGGGPEDT